MSEAQVLDNPVQAIPNRSQETVRNLGRKMESMIKNSSRRETKEKYKPIAKIFESLKANKEALSDQSDLYVTAIRDTIANAFEPKLEATGVIKRTQLDMSGHDSIQLPKDNLLTAVDVNADGTFPSEETTGYDSVTATIAYKGAYTSIPQQLLDKAAVDLLRDRLASIGRAISKKVDSDVVAEFDTVTDPTNSAGYGDVGNYNYLGASTYIGYAEVVDAIVSARQNYADPDVIVTSPAVWGRLMKDSDFKDALAFGTSPQGGVATLQQFGNIDIVTTTQVATEDAYLIDSSECGYIVDGTDIKSYDGRVSNTVQQEVVAIKGYDVKIGKPKSVYGLHGDEATPS